MQQISFMKTKQTQAEKRDDLKKEGGKPLWLKQLETGNDFLPVCVIIFVYVYECLLRPYKCICDTAWQTNNNWGFCGFSCYWWTQTETHNDLSCTYKKQKLMNLPAFKCLQCSEEFWENNQPTLARTHSPMKADAYCTKNSSQQRILIMLCKCNDSRSELLCFTTKLHQLKILLI